MFRHPGDALKSLDISQTHVDEVISGLFSIDDSPRSSRGLGEMSF